MFMSAHTLYMPYVVLSRLAEDAVGQVYGLVAAIAKEYVLRRYSLDCRKFFLQLRLQWVGVTVEGLVVWVLVGIKEHGGSMPAIFVTCRTVG